MANFIEEGAIDGAPRITGERVVASLPETTRGRERGGEVGNFTAGPWTTVGASRVWRTGNSGGAVAVICEPDCLDSGDFREVGLNSKRFDEAMANAQLIAAAPDMYEALVAIRKHLIETEHPDFPCACHTCGLLASALAKAEGTNGEGGR